jgi:2,4-dienoyl-CoA reductase-like NADH-dependent reductase (Old Yellow Enzyme family)
VCSAILCNYSKLKQDSYGQFDNDLYYLMEAFDDVSEKALKDYPLYVRLIECKVDGLQNIQIQEVLE